MQFGNMTLSEAIGVLKTEKESAQSHAGTGVTGMECKKFVDAVDVVCEFVDQAVVTFAKFGSWEGSQHGISKES